MNNNPNTNIETDGLKPDRVTQLKQLCMLMNSAAEVVPGEGKEYLRDMEHTSAVTYPIPSAIKGKFDPFNLPQGLRINRAGHTGQLDDFRQKLLEIYPEAADKITITSAETSTFSGEMNLRTYKRIADGTASIEGTMVLDISDPDIVRELGQYGFKALGLKNPEQAKAK